ncbi:hypothetical protein CC2G_001749 [Coprinopsis cinerea AmutBmut pab1-1]|nr:hypothetical protein CC2G_001749 [Coprinopsis cinerea AmutBmut pab1-1]
MVGGVRLRSLNRALKLRDHRFHGCQQNSQRSVTVGDDELDDEGDDEGGGGVAGDCGDGGASTNCGGVAGGAELRGVAAVVTLAPFFLPRRPPLVVLEVRSVFAIVRARLGKQGSKVRGGGCQEKSTKKSTNEMSVNKLS